MTTFTVCSVAHSDIENRVTMQSDFQPLAIDTFATRKVAEDRVEAWTAEDGDLYLYYVSEGERPVTIWP